MKIIGGEVRLVVLIINNSVAFWGINYDFKEFREVDTSKYSLLGFVSLFLTSKKILLIYILYPKAFHHQKSDNHYFYLILSFLWS